MEVEKYAAEYYAGKEGKDYRVGTIDMLDYIREQCPGLDLHLVLGTDTYKDLIARKWKQSERILNTATVHAISRLGVETTGIEVVSEICLISIDTVKVKVVHHKVPWLAEVSSSLVRSISNSVGIDLSDLVDKQADKDCTAGLLPQKVPLLKDLIDPRVHSYITEHKLYASVPPLELTPNNTSSGDNNFSDTNSNNIIHNINNKGGPRSPENKKSGANTAQINISPQLNIVGKSPPTLLKSCTTDMVSAVDLASSLNRPEEVGGDAKRTRVN
jgi:nicotinic acid mononucleotide adenylyltransferase